MDEFGYQLQKVDPDEVARSRFDLVVVDPSRDGRDGARWTQEEMAKLSGGAGGPGSRAGGPRLVLAYLSFGEAESYRGYWQGSWRPGSPKWLGRENPHWKGNFPVAFWEPAWREIVYGAPERPLDVVIGMGFDGVWLDVIDSYAWWGKQGVKRADDRAREAVIALSRYAKSRKSGFLVFVQNAAELGSSRAYRDAVDGIGREELLYDGDNPHEDEEVSEAEDELDRFARDGKKVLVVEYCTLPSLIDDVYERARKKGYVPYCTVRDLDALVVNPGHAPEKSR